MFMIVRYQKTTGQYANLGDGINSDGSLNVRIAGSRGVVGAESAVTWVTDHLSDAQTIDYAAPTSPGVEFAVFVVNECASVSLTVDIYCRQSAGGSTQNFLLTSFSVAANSKRVLAISHLFAGSVGARIALTPTAPATDAETARVLVREVV